MFFAYIIQSDKNGAWYYGHSENVERRIFEHNAGRTKSTKNKGPWRLIFCREFETKIEASRFELYLKKVRNKDYIKREFKNFFIGV